MKRSFILAIVSIVVFSGPSMAYVESNTKIALMDEIVKGLVKQTIYSVGTQVLNRMVPTQNGYNYQNPYQQYNYQTPQTTPVTTTTYTSQPTYTTTQQTTVPQTTITNTQPQTTTTTQVQQNTAPEPMIPVS